MHTFAQVFFGTNPAFITFAMSQSGDNNIVVGETGANTVRGTIEKYVTQRDKPARCNEGPLPKGSTVYLVRYPSGRYYYFCYQHAESAEIVMARLTGSVREESYNSCTDADNCLFSSSRL